VLRSNSDRRGEISRLYTKGISSGLNTYFKFLARNIYLLAQLGQGFVNFIKKVCVSRYNISWEEKLLPAVAMGTRSLVFLNIVIDNVTQIDETSCGKLVFFLSGQRAEGSSQT